MVDAVRSTRALLSQHQMGSGIDLAENALAVLKRRYLRKGTDGQPMETIEQMFHRVSAHIAAVEEEWGSDVEAVEASFYDLMTSLRFLPNSPTFTGAGTPLGQLAACFVLPISDDMGREEDGIFQTLRNTALKPIISPDCCKDCRRLRTVVRVRFKVAASAEMLARPSWRNAAMSFWSVMSILGRCLIQNG